VSEHIGEEIEQWTRRERRNKGAKRQPNRWQAIETLYVKFDERHSHDAQGVGGTQGQTTRCRAKTREVKLGCVFTQTYATAKGIPCATALRRVS